MEAIRIRMSADGWNVVAAVYASLRLPLHRHAETVSRLAGSMVGGGGGEVAMVGHSLGGLIALAARGMSGRDGWRPGPTCLVGSPVNGSAFARNVLRLPFAAAIAPSCVASLRSGIPMDGMDGHDIAVVAGGKGGTGYNRFMSDDNDGVVSVSETRVGGMETRFHLVRASHVALASDDRTIAAVSDFLGDGRFVPTSPPPEPWNDAAHAA